MPSYQLENWETLTWIRDKDKRLYQVLLHQDLWGNWIVTRAWGRIGTKGRGKHHQLSLKDCQALAQELMKVRKYRKYERANIN